MSLRLYKDNASKRLIIRLRPPTFSPSREADRTQYLSLLYLRGAIGVCLHQTCRAWSTVQMLCSIRGELHVYSRLDSVPNCVENPSSEPGSISRKEITLGLIVVAYYGAKKLCSAERRTRDWYTLQSATFRAGSESRHGDRAVVSFECSAIGSQDILP